jgi:translation initiation factor IF-3
MEHARQWLGEGDKVRAAIAFRGREMTHRELGAKILKKLSEELADIAEVEVAPKMEGYQMFTIFVPKKTGIETKKKASPKPAEAAAEPEKKKEKVEKPKAAKPEPKDDDEIF